MNAKRRYKSAQRVFQENKIYACIIRYIHFKGTTKQMLVFF